MVRDASSLLKNTFANVEMNYVTFHNSGIRFLNVIKNVLSGLWDTGARIHFVYFRNKIKWEATKNILCKLLNARVCWEFA